jgi:cysteine sulfinate desulfinase/cysteine desulfurase-like protein
MDNPVILMHGFSHEQMITIMRAAKAAAKELGVDPLSIAFTSSTPTNMEWKLKDLIAEVREEHEYMKKNPPNGGRVV